MSVVADYFSFALVCAIISNIKKKNLLLRSEFFSNTPMLLMAITHKICPHPTKNTTLFKLLQQEQHEKQQKQCQNAAYFHVHASVAGHLLVSLR